MQLWGVGNDYADTAIATNNWAMMQISNYPVSAMKQTTNERSRDVRRHRIRALRYPRRESLSECVSDRSARNTDALPLTSRKQTPSLSTAES